MYKTRSIIVVALVFATCFQTSFCHTLARLHRQTNPAVIMSVDEQQDRAGIPGLSEIQTAIDVAQFLINVGQQVIPSIIAGLVPPPPSSSSSFMNRMDEAHLVERVRKRLATGWTDDRGM